jgi:hypothetical protein
MAALGLSGELPLLTYSVEKLPNDAALSRS